MTKGALDLSAAGRGTTRRLESSGPSGDAMGTDTTGRYQFFDTLFVAARAFGFRIARRQQQAFEFAVAMFTSVLIQWHAHFLLNPLTRSASYGPCKVTVRLSAFLGFRGAITVRIPPPTFQFKGAARHNLVGFLMAMGAFDGLGSHFH